MRSLIVGCVLCTPWFAHADADHDIMEHESIATDAVCIASYALLYPTSVDAKRRAQGLMYRVMVEAHAHHHTDEDIALMLGRITLNLAKYDAASVEEFARLLGCVERAEEHVNVQD